MRPTLLVTLIFTSFVVLWAADRVQPMDVKAGLWEVTKTTATSGQIPAGLLGKLTPEQRARLEERMNARSVQSQKPITYKTCVTQEQINKGFSFAEDRDRNLCTSYGCVLDDKPGTNAPGMHAKWNEIERNGPFRSD